MKFVIAIIALVCISVKAEVSYNDDNVVKAMKILSECETPFFVVGGMARNYVAGITTFNDMDLFIFIKKNVKNAGELMKECVKKSLNLCAEITGMDDDNKDQTGKYLCNVEFDLHPKEVDDYSDNSILQVFKNNKPDYDVNNVAMRIKFEGNKYTLNEFYNPVNENQWKTKEVTQTDEMTPNKIIYRLSKLFRWGFKAIEADSIEYAKLFLQEIQTGSIVLQAYSLTSESLDVDKFEKILDGWLEVFKKAISADKECNGSNLPVLSLESRKKEAIELLNKKDSIDLIEIASKFALAYLDPIFDIYLMCTSETDVKHKLINMKKLASVSSEDFKELKKEKDSKSVTEKSEDRIKKITEFYNGYKNNKNYYSKSYSNPKKKLFRKKTNLKRRQSKERQRRLK